MNIQDKMQEIHHKFGVTEKANYEIQLFVDDLIKKDRAEQLILHGVSQLLPKRLSNIAYTVAKGNSYDGFVNWWDAQV
jgi:hypothetical protein